MAVRVRLKIRSRSTDKIVEVNALVNSGYETERPELLIPMKVAELLGIWPSSPKPYTTIEYITAGGPVRNYVLFDEAEVCIADACVKTVVCDVVVSPIEEEVLISDQLAGELGIQIIDIAKGVWRLSTDPPEAMRKSVGRQIWR